MIEVSKRNTSFDILRIVASLMVVLLHVAALNFRQYAPTTFEWKTMNFYDSIMRSCVPLFFMLSGAFFIKKDIDLGKLFKNKILPLVLIYLVWAFFYVFDTLGFERLTRTRSVNVFLMIMSGKYHLWFIATLIGLYILHPIFRCIVEYKNGVYVKYYLVVFFVFGVLRSTAVSFFSDKLSLTCRIFNKIPVELIGYSGYVLLGYFLANMMVRKIRPIYLFVVYCLSSAICVVVCQMYSISQGKPVGVLYQYFSITSFVSAISLFLFFKNLNINFSDKIKQVITLLSSLTFGMYLFHPYVLDVIVKKMDINYIAYNPIFSIPIVSFVIIVACFVVTYIMTKIPIMKKLWQF